jgi:exodeoxyribonuclease VII large subunit
MPEIASTHNQFAYSVSEISQSLKRVVEDNFGQVRVRGEISGFKLAASGHAYLKLKDESAVLDAVCWKGVVGKMAFRPEDGMEVVCTGRITTYPGRSNYQIVIDFMEPAGIGALMALLEKRKKQLAAEGLFDESRKKPLPFMPRVIGVITSPTGAVIRDILHRLSDRFPCHVLVWPVLVQGEGAAEQVARAIEGFNTLGVRAQGSGISEKISSLIPDPRPPIPDLLIVARGGGSLEDLWAFNEEIVVRAAAASVIPLISAVGHETDTTLIDYAADRRAPTPTAAAEMAVPVRQELELTLLGLYKRIAVAFSRGLAGRADLLAGLARGLPHPRRSLEVAVQRLDDWSERLGAALPATLSRKGQQLAVHSAKLQPRSLAQSLARHEQDVIKLFERARRMMIRAICDREQRLASLLQLLGSLDYKQVLERGFALVRHSEGGLVARAGGIKPGEALSLEFSDGTRAVKAT